MDCETFFGIMFDNLSIVLFVYFAFYFVMKKIKPDFVKNVMRKVFDYFENVMFIMFIISIAFIILL
jgi:hypothetical protein